MRILMVLNYYFPYTSGLSEYVKRISEALVKRGHTVTVVTTQHDRRLPGKEAINGVNAIRCKYLFRLGKGLVSPSFMLTAIRESGKHDRVNLHMPLLEAGILQPLIGKKSVITYHCDLRLGKKVSHRIIEKLYYFSAAAALKLTRKIITYTEDYARASRMLKHLTGKCSYINPIVDEAHFKRVNSSKSKFRKKYGLEGKKIVGFAGRFVYEKGLPYLLKAIPAVLREIPEVMFVLAGEYSNVAGGSIMAELAGLIEAQKKNTLLLGNVQYDELPEFYSACEVLVLPSIDSLEAFGIVQVEAMYCGTPVVATDLPGVRIPVAKTGMGIVIPPCDEKSIAKAIVSIIKDRKKYIRSRSLVNRHFGKKAAIKSYERALK